MYSLCISTSSPRVSAALICDAALVGSKSEDAQGNASGLVIRLLDELLSLAGIELSAVERYVVDVGPGSFTGTRVGIAMVKGFACSFDKLCAGVSAFDLIAPDQIAAIPSRKDEYCCREPGEEFVLLQVDSSVMKTAVGYGAFFEAQAFPDASNVVGLMHQLEFGRPEALRPVYSSMPNISTPNIPYRTVSE
ncbi:MAG: tRNA (adenosine(37)-N6)-threonylcarbamoyltransferase complex dimerization subunit type 1 TsaB [Fimbriimonadales bacterium]